MSFTGAALHDFLTWFATEHPDKCEILNTHAAALTIRGERYTVYPDIPSQVDGWAVRAVVEEAIEGRAWRAVQTQFEAGGFYAQVEFRLADVLCKRDGYSASPAEALALAYREACRS